MRSWFLRNALDTLERLQGPELRDRVSGSVPKRLLPLVARERLRTTTPFDTLSLEDAEDILFSIDGSLGHGAGTFMEEVGHHSVTRAVVEGALSLTAGDLFGSVVRLRSMLESPFVDVRVLFELTRTAEGLTLAIGVAGRPRATRLLRHYATGAIRAAARQTRELLGNGARISAESIADRALISVVLSSDTASSAPPSRPRTKSSVGRPSGAVAGLVAEVERILGNRPESTPSEPARTSGSSYPPPKRASVRPGRPD